jgi:hypothetical protein
MSKFVYAMSHTMIAMVLKSLKEAMKHPPQSSHPECSAVLYQALRICNCMGTAAMVLDLFILDAMI